MNNLRVNDVIVAVEGQPIATSEELVVAIRSRVPGAVVDLTVIRGTETFETAMRLQSMPPEIWRAEQRQHAPQRR
jgi:S1-C subfamily serine protease